MAYSMIWRVLREKFGTMLLMGVLFGALSFFGLMFAEKRFQSSTDFLVVQTNAGNQDFYTQFKSSEYLGKILSEAVYSERFIDAVVATGKVNQDFLPADKKQKLKSWSQMISVQKNLELGIISVSVKSDKEQDAARINAAIAQVLTEQNMLFRGGDEKSVDIRILSGPILERNPSAAKIVEVVAGAFAAGFMLTAFMVLLQMEVGRRENAVAYSRPVFNDALA